MTGRSGEAAAVGSGAVIGRNVAIGSDCAIGALAAIGDGVRIGNGVEIAAGAIVGADVLLGDQVRIGAGAIVQQGVAIGERAFAKPGAVVTSTVPPAAIVEGNPGTIVGYVDTQRPDRGTVKLAAASAGVAVEATSVRGVTIHNLPLIADLRGDLTVGEFEREILFRPARYFMVLGVPSREIRGEHAHKVCHQFLICVRGSCSVVADDGVNKVEVLLDRANCGLYLPPMTWGIQYKYSEDAVLLVFASDYYDNADYIRDYGEFLRLTQAADHAGGSSVA